MSAKLNGALLAGVVLGLAACGRPAPAPAQEQEKAESRPAGCQVLVTIEAISASHLSMYGGPKAMPQLDALAKTGIVYDDAISTTPVARPALVSILTGMSPDRSSVRDNIHDALPAGLPTIAEDAHKAGFTTTALVSTPFASYSSGLQRGFDVFDGPEAIIVGPAQHRPPIVEASVMAEHFKQWLATRPKDRPFFAWIHLADLNGLATPPPGSAGSSVVKSGDPLEDYDNALDVIDGALGAIVSDLRSDPSAAGSGVIVVGTHGAYLGESGRRGDAFWLSKETLQVPLVRIASLSVPAAQIARHDGRASWTPDVAASLRHTFGGKAPDGADGAALDVAVPQTRDRLAWDFALDDQLALPPLAAVKRGPAISVFQWTEDGHLKGQSGAQPDVAPIAEARPARPRKRELSAANRAAITHAGLRLGASTVRPEPLTDDHLRDLQVARGFVASGRPMLAGKSARRLLESRPEILPAMIVRVFVLASKPSPELSSVRDRMLGLYPDRSEALHWAAHVSLLDHNLKEAAALLDAAIAVGPVEAEMYYDRACVHALQGETSAAFAMLDRAFSSGFRNWDWVDKDPDLSAIRQDPKFGALMGAHGR